MDDRDKRLLNAIQAEFPLVPRPFLAVGAALGLGEAEVIQRIEALKRARIIRQIGGIFDTRSLGYQSSLVAMRVPAERLDAAAAAVSSHPGVSHNYQRSHAFNLWYTIAVPPASDLEWTVRRLHEMAEADSSRLLPTLRLFKIGVQLDMEGGAGARRAEPEGGAYDEGRRPSAGRAGLRGEDLAVIRELQRDLALIPEPYAPMAEAAGTTEARFLDAAEGLRAQGYLRRMAAVLHHREAGFRANAMGVWAVPPERQEEVGRVLATFRAVSHCYLRPTYPDWPYSIFTMVHGQRREDCEGVMQAMAEAAGVRRYEILYSTKEYKKVRVQYFTPEVEEWEARVRRASGVPEARAAAPGRERG